MSCATRLNVKAKVKCKVCGNEYHNTCVGVGETHLSNITSGSNYWLCPPCSSKVQHTNHNMNDKSNPTLTDIFSSIQKILSKQDEMALSLTKIQNEIANIEHRVNEHDVHIVDNDKKLNGLTDQVIGIETSMLQHIQEHSQINIDNNNRITSMEDSLKYLTNENIHLKSKLNELDKHVNLNMLEITGIPEPQGENVFVTFQLIGISLGLKIDNSMVDYCYRLKSTTPAAENKRGPARIIVKFTHKSNRDELLRLRKIKADFSTSNLDLSLSRLVNQHNPVYINEYLSQSQKKLFMQAKDFKKENNIKYLWIKNCNIYMRRRGDSPVINIRNEDDFSKL